MNLRVAAWPNEEIKEQRKGIIRQFMYTVKDRTLSEHLRHQYSKPKYLKDPPTLEAVRGYVQGLDVSNQVRMQKMMTGQTGQSSNIHPTSTPKPGEDKLEHTPENPRSTGLANLPNPAPQREVTRGYLQDKPIKNRQRVDQAAGYKGANLYKD